VSSIELTPIERMLLSNQLRILEELCPDDASGPRGLTARREAIDEGYFLDNLWMYPDSDTMSEEECKEVWDTLDMFDRLQTGAEQQGCLEWLNEQPRGSFLGYDGNHETKFLGFVDYTLYRLEKWTFLNIPRGLNSHARMRPSYQAMLERWKAIPVRGRYQLSEEQIRHIVEVDL